MSVYIVFTIDIGIGWSVVCTCGRRGDRAWFRKTESPKMFS